VAVYLSSARLRVRSSLFLALAFIATEVLQRCGVSYRVCAVFPTMENPQIGPTIRYHVNPLIERYPNCHCHLGDNDSGLFMDRLTCPLTRAHVQRVTPSLFHKYNGCPMSTIRYHMLVMTLLLHLKPLRSESINLYCVHLPSWLLPTQTSRQCLCP